MGIKAFFRPEQARGVQETYELHLGGDVLQVRIKEGELQVRQGAGAHADVVFHTDMPSYLGLFSGQIKPDEAVAMDLIRIDGDPGALSRFLSMCGVPGPD